MNWKEELLHFDVSLFIKIHAGGAAEWLDPLMLAFRNPAVWIPLYAFMLIWSVVKQKNKAIIFIGCTLLTFAIADYGSASILKPLIGRVRPCYNEELAPYLRNLIGCGGRWSTPSSHASNHFALAAFWFFSTRFSGGKKWYWLWLWAALIGYAQVYVGKHYPFDILAGAVYGTLTGLFSYWVYTRLLLKWEARNTAPSTFK